MKTASDIDLALLIEESRLQSFPFLEIMAELEKVSGRRVDVVLLNRAGDLLQHEVRRTGLLIFERDPIKRKGFEVIGRKQYEDFLYLHRRYTRKVLYGKRNG